MPSEPLDQKFLTRKQLCVRWAGCSQKALIRAERRLGLQPYRILRGVLYSISDVERIEAEGSLKAPKRFVGVRPTEKATLREREKEGK